MSGTETEVNATPAAVDLAAAENLDLAEVEGTGDGGKITVDDVRKWLDDEDKTEDAPAKKAKKKKVPKVKPIEVEELDEEVLPVVREGMWVRLHAGPGVLVNRDYSVVRTQLRTTTGPSSISPDKIDYQLETDPVLVKSRTTGEELEVARGQIEAFADERSALPGGAA